MTGSPILYVMITLAAIVLAVILVCIGCKKAGPSKMKKDLIDFSKECDVMLAHLDKFENRLDQFPEKVIQSVDPVINEYIREHVELHIRECLDNPGQEVKIEDVVFEPTAMEDFDPVQFYKNSFLSLPDGPFLSKEGKQVTIRDRYHKMIAALINNSDGECRSIYHYVDNVLKCHFLEYGETIRSILGDSSGKANFL